MNQTITQSIGFLALFFVLVSFQKNKRVNILLVMLTGLLLFVVHFSLLKAWTGALMNLVEAGVVYVAFKKDTERWAQQQFWPYVFIALYVVIGLFTAKSLINFLPIIAQTFGALAVWQTNPRTIRFLMLIPRPLWFIYNATVGSYAGMAAEVCILLSVVVGIVRFDIFAPSKKLRGKPRS
jgi:hypothetical protein